MALPLAAPAPAAAAVTLKILSKARLRPAATKGGYMLSIPDTYSVAYDRSDTQDPTQYFAGNFKTFETVSISRLPLAAVGLQQLEGQPVGSLGALTLDEVVDRLLADTRENQSTFGFKVLAAQPRPAMPAAASASSGPVSDDAASPVAAASSSDDGSSGGTFWDIEYVHQICRGLTSEESGGRRRCVSVTGDRDLQVVSRHYVATFAVRGPYIYLAKGSAPVDAWPSASGLLLASVQSFGLPPAPTG